MSENLRYTMDKHKPVGVSPRDIVTDSCSPVVSIHMTGLAGYQYQQIQNQLRKVIKLMSQLDDRMIAVQGRIDEAATEIVDLINKLRDENLTETGRAALDDIEAKANALADIVPNEPPQNP